MVQCRMSASQCMIKWSRLAQIGQEPSDRTELALARSPNQIFACLNSGTLNASVGRKSNALVIAMNETMLDVFLGSGDNGMGEAPAQLHADQSYDGESFARACRLLD